MDPKHVLELVRKAGHHVRAIRLGMKPRGDHIPYLVFSHEVYPGVEAHLFTIADVSLWLPAFDAQGDVVLYRPRELDEGRGDSDVEEARSDSWMRLLAAIERVTELLTPYRKSVNRSPIPETVWAHHQRQWHFGLRDAPDHEAPPVDMFIDYVDSSIRPLIRNLNELGFTTKESCSGLPSEHPDREPYRPYVMFDDRVYLDVSAHLFTLADITEWIPGPGPHGFDVKIQQNVGEDIPEAWGRFLRGARVLAPLLDQYRNLVSERDGLYRKLRERRELPEYFK
ncbi:MAG: hypothetical protein ACFE8Z_10480 [Candidatus Hermodarchaeota archaeon]